MDLITEVIKVSTKHYEEGHLVSALTGFAHIVKILKETAKLEVETSQQTSQKT